MKHSINRVLQAMIEYDSGDPMRIHHFIKVHAFAAYIGRQEGLDKDTQEILELAAIVHDIGIHLAVENYGSASAKYQEMIGPGEAEAMLEELELPEDGFPIWLHITTPMIWWTDRITRFCWKRICWSISTRTGFLPQVSGRHIRWCSVRKPAKSCADCSTPLLWAELKNECKRTLRDAASFLHF